MPLLKSAGGKPAIWFETKGQRLNDAVVLLHGFAGTHRTWDALSDRLSKSHFVILPDLPGHGRSRVSAPSTMGVASISEAIADLIKVAQGRARARSTAVVGYSLGGRVALDLACNHHELLSCIVLEGASPGIESDEERLERKERDDALADEIERKGIEWFVDYWQDIPLFSTQRHLPSHVRERIRSDRLSNSARGIALSLRAAGTGEMSPLWTRIEDLQMPVLLVVGKWDEKYAAIGRAMQRKISGSTLTEVDGAGHCVHLERPEDFADLVEGFIEGFIEGRHEILRAAK